MEPYRPPLSGAIIYETAKQSGHDIKVVDLNIELYHRVGSDKFHDIQMDFTYFGNRQYDDLDNFLSETMPKDHYDLIMISAFSFYSQIITMEICKWLRKQYDSEILLGGPAVQYPFVVDTPQYLSESQSFGEMMRDMKLIDHYISGEGEIALKEFLSDNKNFPGINNNNPSQINDLDNLPIPNYDGFDLNKYEYLLGERDFFIYGSRGCVKSCKFCDLHVYWPKYKYRSGQNIAEEMIKHYERYGTKNFYFADSLFNGSLKAFTDFLNTLARYDAEKNFRWGGMAIIRPKNQHPPEMYDLIAASGTSFWVVGIETFSERVRFEMGKKFTNDDMIYHLEQSSRIGLENTFLMMPTWPSETLAEHEEYLSWFEKLKKYLANGSLTGMSFSPRLIALEKTALGQDPHLIYKSEEIRAAGLTKEYYWYDPRNPDLNMKERCRRTLALIEEARKHKFPIHRLEQRLHDLKWLVESIANNPEIEFKNWRENENRERY